MRARTHVAMAAIYQRLHDFLIVQSSMHAQLQRESPAGPSMIESVYLTCMAMQKHFNRMECKMGPIPQSSLGRTRSRRCPCGCTGLTHPPMHWRDERQRKPWSDQSWCCSLLAPGCSFWRHLSHCSYKSRQDNACHARLCVRQTAEHYIHCLI